MFRIVNVRLQQSVLCLFEQRQGDKLSPGENDNIQTQRGTLSEYKYFVHTPLPRTSLGSLLGGPWLLGTPWGEPRGALGALGGSRVPSWGPQAILVGPLGGSWEPLGGHGGTLGDPWEPSGGARETMGKHRGSLGGPWSPPKRPKSAPGTPRVPRRPPLTPPREPRGSLGRAPGTIC